MGKLSDILFGKKDYPAKKAAKWKRKQELYETYQKGKRKAELEEARRRGYQAGKGRGGVMGKLEGAGRMLEGAKMGAESYIEGMFGDFGLEPERRKRKRAKRRRKTIVIKV